MGGRSEKGKGGKWEGEVRKVKEGKVSGRRWNTPFLLIRNCICLYNYDNWLKMVLKGKTV